MSQRQLLIAELKSLLRQRGFTYADVAKALGLSLATVKRLFAAGDFSLSRLDAICAIAGISITELAERAQSAQPILTKLSEEQERELASDPRLFLLTYLLINRWSVPDIVANYALTDADVQRLLIRLDRLRILELQPGNRVRLLVTRNFAWQPGGALHRLLTEKLLGEYFAEPFVGEQAELRFFWGSLTDASLEQIRRSMLALLREATELADQDAALPLERRKGAAAVFALRPWHYSGFRRLRRGKADPTALAAASREVQAKRPRS